MSNVSTMIGNHKFQTTALTIGSTNSKVPRR